LTSFEILWLLPVSMSLICSSLDQWAKFLIIICRPFLLDETAPLSFHRRSFQVEGMRISRSTTMKVKGRLLLFLNEVVDISSEYGTF